MDISISLNQGALLSQKGFVGSRLLCEAFINRGHNLRAINPADVFYRGKKVFSRNSFGYLKENDSFYKREEDFPLEGDIFFVYGLGEDPNNMEVSKRFMQSLFVIENQYPVVLNSAETTSYEDKEKQNSYLLNNNFPVIPSYRICSRNDLEEVILEGEKIIAKPKLGFLGKGVLYFDNSDNLPEDFDFNEYVFQRFVPANEERRYLFLDGSLILQRSVGRKGPPGNEVYDGVTLIEGPNEEREMAREIIKNLDIFYGAVDFRGHPRSYILEINGSGTGVAPPDDGNLRDCYNIAGPIVKATERKLEK